MDMVDTVLSRTRGSTSTLTQMVAEGVYQGSQKVYINNDRFSGPVKSTLVSSSAWMYGLWPRGIDFESLSNHVSTRAFD